MTKTADPLLALRKKTPAGEGAHCRQKQSEDSGAITRAANVPCPKSQGAQHQHPTLKSDLEAIGYPGVQNICHINVDRDRTRRGKVRHIFDITQSLILGLALATVRIVVSSSGPQAIGNSLMYGPISVPTPAPNFISLAGVTRPLQYTLISSNRD